MIDDTTSVDDTLNPIADSQSGTPPHLESPEPPVTDPNPLTDDTLPECEPLDLSEVNSLALLKELVLRGPLQEAANVTRRHGRHSVLTVAVGVDEYADITLSNQALRAIVSGRAEAEIEQEIDEG